MGLNSLLGSSHLERSNEVKGFRIGRSKTEYMECEFKGSLCDSVDSVTLKNHKLSRSECLKYLDSIFSKDGAIMDDAPHRIQVGWIKWRSA